MNESLEPTSDRAAWEEAWRARWARAELPNDCIEGALAAAWAQDRLDDGLVLWTALILLDLRAGSTRTDVSRQGERIAALFPHAEPGFGETLLARGFDAGWLSGPSGGAGLVKVGDAVFAARILDAETQLGWAVEARRAAGDAALPGAEGDRSAQPLTEDQKAAVARCLTARLTLLTGGPGTGKSTVLGEVVRRFLAGGGRPEDVSLAAPTGKAAQRLSALPGPDALPEARTLHRLLGYRPRHDRFSVGPDAPLPHRLVVVDEATMVDLRLMTVLLAGLRPDAHLVLSGDPDQLPSVDAGAVFRDLTERHPQAVARLIQNHRLRPEAVALRQAAEAVRAGRLPKLHWSDGPIDGGGGVRVADPTGRIRFLREWHHRFLESAPHLFRMDHLDPERAELALASAEACKVLTHLRDGPEGSRATNELLGRLRRRRTPSWSSGPFVPGQPVIMTRNDYGRRLFNGDMGVVVEGPGGVPRALFRNPRGGSMPVRWTDLGNLVEDLEPADALTVHKAQGSEFERVAILLPLRDHLLAGRSFLYTALTRARQAVWWVGTPEVAARAAARLETRHTGAPA